ncbi:MAG TPA: D-tyrosyl-tRNA(Tyr) deacylase [Planctomycetes bacterium]|nr:D-tyrosyl-tRNA(Tyr) deacylase [Planctomycetota bacterium]HIK61971.1 D-tyrosyl-tRNA(Tyr) deacylase [Planctomycetota bacterium]
MKAVIQRVTQASVDVEGARVAQIGRGALVLVGILDGDDEARARALAERVGRLRYFPDDQGRMNLSLDQVGGELLVVSQFTLAADGRRGRRPSFDQALEASLAEPLYECFVEALEALGVPCSRGVFGAQMAVELLNDGPVTFVLES